MYSKKSNELTILSYQLKQSNMIGLIIFFSIVYVGHTLNLTDKDIKFNEIKIK